LPGIFFAAFLESTFVPLPAEFTMIPAGFLIYQGKMNLAAVLGLSVAGTVVGSLVNYYLARFLGRPLIVRFQKYLFLNDTKIYKIEAFFAHHGEISTLIGRLVPGMRHLIAFPAGLARMDVRTFAFYTAAGGTVWMGFLTWVGYFLGGKDWRKYATHIVGGGIVLAIILVVGYVIYIRLTAIRDDSGDKLKETLRELAPHGKHPPAPTSE
jgi:membrane protein DedA with SNARE-associated domain